MGFGCESAPFEITCKEINCSIHVQNGGQKGVELMLHLFHEEFKKAMQLMGCQSIKDITRDRLAILDSSGFLKRLDQLDWR